MKIGILAVIAGVVTIWAMAVGGGEPKSPAPPAIGAVATLSSECPAMSTKRGWEDFSSSVHMGDRAGAARTIVEGGALLAAGTEVMVKDWSFPGTTEVSVQRGPAHFGERFFMSWDCVSRKVTK